MREVAAQTSEPERWRPTVREQTPIVIGRIALTPQEEELDNLHAWELIREQMRVE